ncbi:hypothetical protein ABB37_08229 [Leptomonas pyrrhocoris]|uniref:RanBP2-type domain-containing protein n=1 Tax=Leptomonas pyrrhocoris TaxID=157538 RepID=A0A0N0DS95_LEPPY|nr:hypothetical protein ABB37_08229 [Leptomonas pyrrhocoris]XP_015654104.1 hypothetical protein ABB37_08229 [Leptomonas pyrrhocoris]KPA75664.1 hypothetical protein ABB37_08229 [Leptomonas pyrrhocoris]KPA75665.1 hypothetical protein ABB37_08229 [Leptomonas pyrrhocoris]|eukprot:XP_015654103.1 hypothetical protein ABB37_08229 [Leptomonas pyrrhocoris]
MLRLASEPQRKREPKMPECSRMLFGLALLLTLLSEGMMNTQYTALSTVITANTDPTALQQLATFAAMEDVAEEEQLDWGSSGRLVRTPINTIVKPRNAETPDPAKMAATPPNHSRVNSLEVHSEGLSKSVSEAESSLHSPAEPEFSAASSSSSSRRRPHRRHRRHSGASASDAFAAATAVGDVVVELAASQPVHSYPMWTQFHVMEVAYSTGANNFVHLTERFLQYQQMFPVVYRCDLAKVVCPEEAELLALPRSGLSASSHWTCAKCGKKHEAVRESCLRCRTPGPYAKLFVGQTIKEVDCTESLVRFLHATHPEVRMHRVECHRDSRAGCAVGRGKGCASVYVAREDAAALQQKLHHNAFFDINDATGELVVYYVYSEQQKWLHSFVQLRNERADQRPLFLPLAPLVVEQSVGAAVPAKRPSGPHGRPQDRGSFDLAPVLAIR